MLHTKFFKNIFANINSEKNKIQKRIILSNLQYFASLLTDIENMNRFKKYFVTKEQANINIENKKQNNEPIYAEDGDWYEHGEEIKFYVYQDPPIGVTNILYGEVTIIEFLRRGYDDVISIAGIYSVDENTGITDETKLMGVYIFEGLTIMQVFQEINEHGIRGYGKLYITGGRRFVDFDKLYKYSIEQVNKKNKKLE